MVDLVAYATFESSRAFQRTVTVDVFARVASRRMKNLRMIQASLTRSGVINARTRGLKSTAIFNRRVRVEIRRNFAFCTLHFALNLYRRVRDTGFLCDLFPGLTPRDRDREKPRGAPLPHHPAYGSVQGGSSGEQGQPANECNPSELKKALGRTRLRA
jgi:hypothetical protein